MVTRSFNVEIDIDNNTLNLGTWFDSICFAFGLQLLLFFLCSLPMVHRKQRVPAWQSAHHFECKVFRSLVHLRRLVIEMREEKGGELCAGSYCAPHGFLLAAIVRPRLSRVGNLSKREQFSQARSD